MLIGTACEAVTKGLCLEVRYDGYVRVVEVHACGYTHEGHAIMRVWQVRGGSVSGERSGWKLLRLDEARTLSVLVEASQAPRQGYRRGDKDKPHPRAGLASSGYSEPVEGSETDDRRRPETPVGREAGRRLGPVSHRTVVAYRVLRNWSGPPTLVLRTWATFGFLSGFSPRARSMSARRVDHP